MVILNFDKEPTNGCTFSLPQSDLSPGVYSAVDLFAGNPVGDITVENGGGFNFVPQFQLPPGNGFVLLLNPA